MLKQFSNQIYLDGWYLEIPPAQITVHHVKTGRQAREPSLIAVRRGQPDKLTAIGREALKLKGAPDTVVLSPFDGTRIVQYPAAQMLLKTLMKQVRPAFPLLKPVVCVHIQDRTTQVEEVALADAAIQSGARKVFFYTDSLPVILDRARNREDLQDAVIIHIDLQD